MTFSSNIFNSARLKLTLYYVLTMMTISLSFSILLYQGATMELRRSLRTQALRFVPRYDRLIPYSVVTEPDEAVFHDARNRIIVQLIALDSAILIFSSLASYVLAGKTLKPIEQVMEDQKRFVSDASHELRTPLTAMRTEIEVLLREKKISAEDTREILQSNLEEVDKMRSLSDYLLKLTKYDTKEQTLPTEELRVSPLIASVIKNVKTLAQAKHVTIEEDIADTTVTGNKISLIELFTILLDNAIKYSNEGDVVTIRAGRRKKSVCFEVQDHGAGIRAT
jgi:signal transduction histidine kinase